MWSEILTLGLAILGLVAILMFTVMKLLAWRTEEITITLPLKTCDKDIFYRIYNIRSIFEFCGMKEKCTVVIINYGAPEWFCNEILAYYEKYNFIRLINYYDLADKLF